MSGPVEVVGPKGERGTVDAADVPKMAKGWRAVTPDEATSEAEQAKGGDTTGELAAAALGAGRAASFGLSDLLISEAANVAHGDQARKDALHALDTTRRVNPKASAAGELGGLLAGGGGIVAAGEKVGAAVAARVGEGLLGDVAETAVRGAVESAGMGAQQQVTEDVLGDHGLHGQAIFANAAKEALLGGAIGAGFGVAGHYAKQALPGLLGRARGPISDAMADELAGVDGAGRPLVEQARIGEQVADAARNAGATTEQAAREAAETAALARAGADAGPLTGPYDSLVGRIQRGIAGDNAERRQTLEEGYRLGKDLLAKQNESLNSSARAMADAGTKALRDIEDIVNEAQFTQKPQQVRRLIDPAMADAQRDAVATIFQDTRSTMNELYKLESKGGIEGPLSKILRVVKDKEKIAFAEGLTPEARYLAADDLKRAIGRAIPWDRLHPGGTESDVGRFGVEYGHIQLSKLYNRIRSGLEDEGVWGAQGAAQRAQNETFTAAKSRRDAFGRQFTVSLDRQSGAFVPQIDPGKIKSVLSNVGNAESDTAVDTIKAFISGLRARADVVEQHAELTAAQRSALTRGRSALDSFEGTFNKAANDGAIVMRLSQAAREEAAHTAGHGAAAVGSAIGGLVGGFPGAAAGGALGSLFAHASAKPLSLMRKLADVRHSLTKVESAVKAGFGKLRPAAMASDLAPRERAAAVKEMQEIRQLAGNPQMLESRISRMTGGLQDYAPKTARAVGDSARRAIMFLAIEAPGATVQTGLLGTYKQTPRISDQQVSDWEAKRRGALGAPSGASAPETVLADMKQGRLNRDALRAMQYVHPELYAHIQQMAQQELTRMEQSGQLDKLSYQHKASIAALLQIIPDQTWTPEFINLLQSTKQPPAPAPQAGPAGGAGKLARKASKPTANMFATESTRIEGAP